MIQDFENTLDLISKKSLSFKALIEALKSKNSILIDGALSSEIAIAISFLNKNLTKDILIITSDKTKDILYKNLSSQNQNLLELISLDSIFFEDVKQSYDVIGNRFETLNKLITCEKNHLVIASFHSALQKLVPKNLVENLTINLKVEENYDFDKLIEDLAQNGYERSSIVSDKGEFAIRGGIIDVFPTNKENPYRIDFFSDSIESIRTFDIASQKSIEKTKILDIFVADEMKILKETSNLETIFDYLKKDFLIIFDDLYNLEDSFVNLKLKKSKFFLNLDEFLSISDKNKKIYFSEKKIESLSKVTYLDDTLKSNNQSISDNKDQKNALDKKYFKKISFEIFQKEIFSNLFMHPFISFNEFLHLDKIDNILDHLHTFLEKNLKVIFLISNDSEKKHLLEILSSPMNEKFLDKISFENNFLSSGFIISDISLCLITYSDITKRTVIRRQKFRQSYQTLTSDYHHLQVNDLVVHFHSGIGKYLGCEKHTNHLGIETEFLIIEYSKHSKLYTPISQAHLISKYIGSTHEKPTLNELGSSKWQKTKVLAQRKIIGYASDLLEMQAERESFGGFEYPKDSEEVLLFDQDFPYEETLDQLKAIEDIKNDMTSQKAMDRLLCADVGFGKTEVAMRAAFKAVYDGKKQVAVLVPTTVLAMQHFDTFKERMGSFAINISIVSRFNTTKENKEILEKVANGKVDILIGTHRLLSKDVFFENLGLIIIDEEQRFGVRAKEHLKTLKKSVDCLTLSATPLPRTLYMSLIKIKDISIINTPPHDRLPIKTIISENDDTVIKNAISQELFRQGQVFFIHNRVESIHQRANHIKSLFKDIKIEVVHGQMPPDSVDSIFHLFKTGEIDILFATTIIENGIDVPNANTIIIDRADTFGLADLYQLRGRVGRWNRPSFAYFLTQKNRQISEISQKRLSALLKSSGFGGGMKIAMIDLEIRGAGDILGVKQSGQISNIGFHLYCKLLKKAILSLKDKKKTSFIETKIEFPYAAFLPGSYISEENLRMEIYYRLGEITTFEGVDEIEKELEDRFGSLLEPVKELLSLTKIKIFANESNFTYLKFGDMILVTEKFKNGKKFRKNLILPKKKDLSIDDFRKKVLELLKISF